MDDPQDLPPTPRTGSPADRLHAIEGLIARLERMRATLIEEEEAPPAPGSELYGPYVDAPVWPWLLAGWTLGAGLLLLFVVGWVRS